MNRTGFVFSGLLVIVSVVATDVSKLEGGIVVTGDVTPPLPWSSDTSPHIGGFLAPGTLTVDAGSVLHTGTVYIAPQRGEAEATVTGSGSKWTVLGGLNVGLYGPGALRVEAGGEVYSENGYVGWGARSTATVTGTGSKWTNAGNLYVGYVAYQIVEGGVGQIITNGTGTLTVDNGGAVSTDTLFASLTDLYGNGTIAARGGVLDANLVFDAAHGLRQTIGFGEGGTLNLHIYGRGVLGVGYRGVGTLSITDGRSVSSLSGYLGYSHDSRGTATVTGTGSKWTSGDLYVGYAGTGAITVQGGAEVSTLRAYVPYASRSQCTAVVTGPGSKWTSEHLYVGYGGTGVLTVQAGAEVSTIGASLGYWRNSRGTAIVTGAGSKWINSGDLSLGFWGYYEGSYGTLNIENQGMVWVGGTLRLSRGTKLTLDGGTLDARTIDARTISMGGTTNFLAGTLRFGTYQGDLTNAGATLRSRDGVFGMRVEGNYTQGPDAKLLIEIAGLPDSFLFDLFDVLTVTGTANLAGTLALDFSAFVPPEPTTYKFVKAPTITGTFSSFEVIGLDPSLVSFNIPAGEFTVVPEPTTLALLLAAAVYLLPYARRKRN